MMTSSDNRVTCRRTELVWSAPLSLYDDTDINCRRCGATACRCIHKRACVFTIDSNVDMDPSPMAMCTRYVAVGFAYMQ